MLGRTSLSINGSGAAGTTDRVIAGGMTYLVNWTSTSASYSVPVVGTGEANCMSATQFTVPASTNMNVVSSITLPNSQSYTFYYGTNNPDSSLNNPYGLLSEIIYPDGGWVKYTYTLSSTPSLGGLFTGWASAADGSETPEPNTCLYLYSAPVVATRTVSYDGTSIAQSQSFAYSTTFGSNSPLWLTKTANVTTTDERTGKSYLATYSYTPFDISNPPFSYESPAMQIPVEYQVSTYDWGNTATPLETVTKYWQNQFSMSEQDITLSSGDESKTVYTPGVLMPQEIDEYDFGSNTAARKTLITYQPITAPGSINIPCKTIITDGNGTTLSEIDNYFDGGTTLCGAETVGSSTSPVSGPALPANTHDGTLFGPTSTTPRGNVTESVQQASVGPSEERTYSYDETGQVTSMTDPCGNTSCADMPGGVSHKTTYSYSDSPVGGNPAGNSNAYLTAVTDPAGYQRSFTYNYLLGKLASATDVNGQTTHYVYNTPPSGCNYTDDMDRLSEVDYPDGGKTTFCYNDAAPSIITSVSQWPAPSFRIQIILS